MRFSVECNYVIDDCWYLTLHFNKWKTSHFDSIARILDLKNEFLDELITKYEINIDAGLSYFNSKEDVENIIKELEPYLVMAKLTE